MQKNVNMPHEGVLISIALKLQVGPIFALYVQSMLPASAVSAMILHMGSLNLGSGMA